MWKKKERWTAAALLLAMVVVTGLCWYVLYIRQQFYDEGTRNLLETYEQVDKAFTIFSRSNWNMLNEWGKSLQAANEKGLAEERLRIACGEGAVEIISLQAEGGKRMAAPDYFRGHPLER